MLTIILAETALEPIPLEILRNRLFRDEARKRGRKPEQILLDSSKHYPAMRGLANSEKRGRPDLTHFALLLALDSPLNRSGNLKVFVHCQGDKVISVNSEVRLPRVYNRFCGLMEDLFDKGKIETPEGKELMSVKKQSLDELVQFVSKTCSVSKNDFLIFDPQGKSVELNKLEKEFPEKNSCAIIGGFAHGSFESPCLEELRKISISKEELAVWTVVSETLCAFEHFR
jgi:rRNA small subunit pseudouridine methyltransferase Nep1